MSRCRCRRAGRVVCVIVKAPVGRYTGIDDGEGPCAPKKRASVARGGRRGSLSPTGTRGVIGRSRCLMVCLRRWSRSKQHGATAGRQLVGGRQFRDSGGRTDTGECHRHQGNDMPSGGGGVVVDVVGGFCCSGTPKFKWGFLCSAPRFNWELSSQRLSGREEAAGQWKAPDLPRQWPGSQQRSAKSSQGRKNYQSNNRLVVFGGCISHQTQLMAMINRPSVRPSIQRQTRERDPTRDNVSSTGAQRRITLWPAVTRFLLGSFESCSALASWGAVESGEPRISPIKNAPAAGSRVCLVVLPECSPERASGCSGTKVARLG